MMKTKLTLFVTVLAVALFGVGSVSVASVQEEKTADKIVTNRPAPAKPEETKINSEKEVLTGIPFGRPQVGVIVACETKNWSKMMVKSRPNSGSSFSATYNLKVLKIEKGEVTEFELRDIKLIFDDKPMGLASMKSKRDSSGRWQTTNIVGGIKMQDDTGFNGLFHVFVRGLWDKSRYPKLRTRIGDSWVADGDIALIGFGANMYKNMPGKGQAPLKLSLARSGKDQVALDLAIKGDHGFRKDNYSGGWIYDPIQRINKSVRLQGVSTFSNGTKLEVGYVHSERVLSKSSPDVAASDSPENSSTYLISAPKTGQKLHVVHAGQKDNRRYLIGANGKRELIHGEISDFRADLELEVQKSSGGMLQKVLVGKILGGLGNRPIEPNQSIKNERLLLHDLRKESFRLPFERKSGQWNLLMDPRYLDPTVPARIGEKKLGAVFVATYATVIPFDNLLHCLPKNPVKLDEKWNCTVEGKKVVCELKEIQTVDLRRLAVIKFKGAREYMEPMSFKHGGQVLQFNASNTDIIFGEILYDLKSRRIKYAKMNLDDIAKGVNNDGRRAEWHSKSTIEFSCYPNAAIGPDSKLVVGNEASKQPGTPTDSTKPEESKPDSPKK